MTARSVKIAIEHLIVAGFRLDEAGCRAALAKVNDAIAAARTALARKRTSSAIRARAPRGPRLPIVGGRA
jgi:hypothetical protein